MHDSPTAQMLATTDAAVAFLLLYFVPLLGRATLLFLGFSPTAVTSVECGVIMLMFGILLLMLFAAIRNEGLAWRLRGNVLRTVYTYLGFSLVWVPFALMLYPMLVHILEADLPAQPPLLYLVGDTPLEGRVLVVIVACLLAPMGEELFFRGYIYRFVDLRWGPTVALWITSIWFGIMHGIEYALPLTFMGFLFGYLRHRTGGLAAPILAHMLHNTVTVGCFLLWPELIEVVFDAPST